MHCTVRLHSKVFTSWLAQQRSIMAAKFAGQLAKYSALCYCGAYCISEYVFDFTLCVGPSMLPTIKENDVVLTEHISTRFLFNIKRGDIVIFKSPTDPKQFLCKRVRGLEFDVIPAETSWKFLKTTKYIPRGHVWLQGDNENNSTDSRCFGPVPFGLIRGRAVMRVWPWNGMGWLDQRWHHAWPVKERQPISRLVPRSLGLESMGKACYKKFKPSSTG